MQIESNDMFDEYIKQQTEYIYDDHDQHNTLTQKIEKWSMQKHWIEHIEQWNEWEQ